MFSEDSITSCGQVCVFWHRLLWVGTEGSWNLNWSYWRLWPHSKNAPFGVSAESTWKVQRNISCHGSTCHEHGKHESLCDVLLLIFHLFWFFTITLNFLLPLVFFYHIFFCHWLKIMIALLSARSPLLVEFFCWSILWWFQLPEEGSKSVLQNGGLLQMHKNKVCLFSCILMCLSCKIFPMLVVLVLQTFSYSY